MITKHVKPLTNRIFSAWESYREERKKGKEEEREEKRNRKEGRDEEREKRRRETK